MFGNMLGVKVAATFVSSMRAEEMGRIVGYAISGLCEEDMADWNDPVKGKRLRKEHGTLDQYLLHTIRDADKWASFRFQRAEPPEEGFQAALRINEHEGALGNKRRGRNVLDHCFVRRNSDPDAKPKGVLVLGTSTAMIMAREHGFSFAPPFKAIPTLF